MTRKMMASLVVASFLGLGLAAHPAAAQARLQARVQGTAPMIVRAPQARVLLANGYCNAFGCFGNICHTPVGGCLMAGFGPIGGPCVCWSYGSQYPGAVGS